jgi:hypothetical protein
MNLCIVSEEQTGVDRGALDGALAGGLRCGGWWPDDRRDEAGTIPKHYPLIPLPQGGYLARTRHNVADSDGTLVIHFGPPTGGGTTTTIRFAQQMGKPLLCIDAARLSLPDAVAATQTFVETWRIHVLNVAGPRGRQEVQGHKYAEMLVRGSGK